MHEQLCDWKNVVNQHNVWLWSTLYSSTTFTVDVWHSAGLWLKQSDFYIGLRLDFDELINYDLLNLGSAAGPHPNLLWQTGNITAGPVFPGDLTQKTSKLHMNYYVISLTKWESVFQSDTLVSIVLPTIHEVDLFRWDP